MPGLFNRLQDEISAREKQQGLSPVDLLDMPEPLANIINQIVRSNGMKLEAIAEKLGQSSAETQTTLDELVQKGYVRKVEVKTEAKQPAEIWYKAHFSRKADKSLSLGIWSALDDVFEKIEKD